MLKRWTPEEDETLRRLYPSATREALTEALGRTWEAIKDRGQALGVKRNRRTLTPEQRRTYWREYFRRRIEQDPEFRELRRQYCQDFRAKRRWEREQQQGRD